MEKTTMEAIQDLIEHGAMIEKKSNNQGSARRTAAEASRAVA
jgi:hypothetical protein